MEFVFDIRKATAAAAYLCEKAGRGIDMLPLLKMLYLAEKRALQEWQRSITGDRLVSMANGPLLSRVYDLIRGRVLGSDMTYWSKFFAPKVGNRVSLKDSVEVDLDPLSQRETDALDRAFAELNGLTVHEMVQKLHVECSEWKDPGNSSSTINPRDILGQVMTEEEIDRASVEWDDVLSARLALARR